MNCPACLKPLSVGFELAENQFVAWCGNGPCPSMEANEGAFGRSEEVAMQNLITKLNQEPDWNHDK